MRKVFGIGFHKTGTTTLDSALQILGFNVAPVRTDLVESLSNGDLNPSLELANNYDAFQDNPWPILYKKMYQMFPNGKFVLTVREKQKWIKSVINSFGGKSTPMREWIYGVGKGDPQKNPNLFIDRYTRHNLEVREFFSDKKGSFLELNWETANGWDELCEFLEMTTPNEAFPHANKGNYKTKTKSKFRLFQK